MPVSIMIMVNDTAETEHGRLMGASGCSSTGSPGWSARPCSADWARRSGWRPPSAAGGVAARDDGK